MSGGIIELPFPAKILWPNGRAHWAAKHRAFKKHREWARLAGIAAGLRNMPIGVFSWSVTFYPKTRHPIDRDNALASLKAYQDGLAAAMGTDDVHFGTPQLHFAEPVKHGKVVVRIEA